MNHRLLSLFCLSIVTGNAPAAEPRSGASAEPAPVVEVHVVERDGFRIVTSDGLPDHPTGDFPNRNNPNRIAPQRIEYRMTLAPEGVLDPVPIGMNPFGIAVNGIVFDPSAAEFWQRNPQSGWQFDAMTGAINLGLDDSNAHVQPDGSYHYHSIPVALVEQLKQPDRMTHVGWAGDGFPIYAVWGHTNRDDLTSPLTQLKPSYRVRQGARDGGPGGRFDGTFVQDWEFVAGSGDLDECNGRFGPTPEFPDGIYHYYLTDAFPFIPRQWAGTPDASFQRRRMPPGSGPGGPGGPTRGRP
jgi:hypothetical protein